MATLILSEYLKQLNQLLDEGQYSEVADHCRHILSHYPRHVDTYRLLAKVYLEQHAYEAAADLFARVLSADPNDVIAHVGLAIVHREGEQLDRAVWHMERAYEIAPYNPAVREELLQLYRLHRGKRPERLPLTQPALAHLYVRGELYQLAIDELRLALEEAPDRVDLAVLLAESQWRNGQRVAAVTTCQQVLDRLPNCIDVNAILADIWMETGQVDEAQAHLRRLQELTLPNAADRNPESAVYSAFMHLGAPPLAESIAVEQMDGFAGAGGSDGEGESGGDWLADADVLTDAQDGVYTWLQDLSLHSDDALSAPEEEGLFAGQPVEVQTDWFLDETATALDVPAIRDDADLDAAAESEAQDGIFSPQMGSLATSDWFSDERTGQAPSAGLDELSSWIDEWEADSEEDDSFAERPPDREMVDWSSPDLSLDLGDVPEWLEGTSDDYFEPVHMSEEESASLLLDLSNLGADELETPEGGATDWFVNQPDDQASDLPSQDADSDWFHEKAEVEALEAGEDEPGDENGIVDNLDWLDAEPRSSAVAAPEDAPEQPEADEIPDWMLTAQLSLPSRQTDQFSEEDSEPTDEAEIDGSLLAWLATTDGAVDADDDDEPDVLDSVASEEEGLSSWLMTAPLGAVPDRGQVESEASDEQFESQAGWDDDDLSLWLDDASEASTDAEPDVLDTINLDELAQAPELLTGNLAEESDSRIPTWLLGGDVLEDTLAPEESDDEDALDELFGEFAAANLESILVDSLGESDESNDSWFDLEEDIADDGVDESFADSMPETADFVDDADGFDLPVWMTDTGIEKFKDSGSTEPDETHDLIDEVVQDAALPDWLGSADDRNNSLQSRDEGDTDSSPKQRDSEADFLEIAGKDTSSLLDWLSDTIFAKDEDLEAAVIGDKGDNERGLNLLPDDDPGALEQNELDEAESWLSELSGGLAGESTDELQGESSLPDWLSELSESDSRPFGDDQVEAVNRLLEEESDSAQTMAAATSLLDWFEPDTDEEVQEVAAAKVEEDLSVFDADTVPETDSLDWLSELAAQGPEDRVEPDEMELAEPVRGEGGAVANEALEWLADMSTDELEEPDIEPTDMDMSFGEEDEVADEALEWLAELGTDELEELEEPAEELARQKMAATVADDVTDDALEWLAELGADDLNELAEEPVRMEMATAREDFMDDALEWMDDLGTGESEEPAGPDEGGEVDWMDGLEELEEPAELLYEPIEMEMAAAGESEEIGEDVDWLAELGVDELAGAVEEPAEVEMALAGLAEDDALDWMAELSVDDLEEPGELLYEPIELETAAAGVSEEADEDVDWLAELGVDDLDEVAESVEESVELARDPVGVEGADNDIDWLSDLGTVELEETAAEPADLEMAFADADADEEAGDELEWLGELGTAELEETAAEAADLEMAFADADADEEAGDELDWLGELGTAELEETAAEAADLEMAFADADADEEAGDELDWLGELGTAELEETAAEAADLEMAFADADADEEAGDELEWLGELGAAELEETAVEAADLEMAFADADADEEAGDELEWLGELGTAELEETAVEAAELEMAFADADAEEAAGDELEWMDELGTAELAETAVEAAELEMAFADADADEAAGDELEWLGELGTAELEETAAEAADLEMAFADADAEEAAGDELEWLGELGTAELEETAAEAADLEMAFADADAEEAAGDELEWLGELGTAELEETAAEAADLEMAFADADAEEAAGDELEWMDELGTAELEETAVEAADLEMAFADAYAVLDSDDMPADVVTADEGEDPMAWLEQLASEQQTPIEPLPTVADRALPETVVPDPGELEEAEAPQTAADSDLDELIFPEDAMFPSDVGEPTDVPEGLDDSMAWLAELMAEQGIEQEAEDQAPAAGRDVVQEHLPKTALEDNEESEEEAKESTVSEQSVETPDEISDPVLADLDWLETLALTSSPPIDYLMDTNLTVTDPAASDLTAALDWIEQQLALAENDKAAAELEELEIDVSQIPEDPEETMAWLENLSDRDEISPERKLSEMKMPQHEEAAADALDLIDSDVPEDPDEAMAWLDSLATEQSAATEELTMAAGDAIDLPMVPDAVDEIQFPEDAMFPSDVGVPTDVPEALDDSMIWLADLMAEQGVSLDEADSVTKEESAPVDSLDLASAVGDTADLSAPLRSDRDETMDWLASMAASDSQPEPAVSELEEMSAGPSEDTRTIAAESEKFDEADSSLFDEADIDLGWLAEYDADVDEAEDVDTGAVEDVVSFDDDPTGEFQVTRIDESLFSSDPGIEFDPELAESWPEWLSADESAQPALGETGWLRNVAEPDVAGWLAAEEEVTSDAFDASVFDETGPLSSAVFDVGPLPDAETGSSANMSDPRLTVPIMSVNQDDLDKARQALSAGDYATAVRRYQRLVESGEGLSILIADLETAAQSGLKQSSVHRLLGDAYMQNGQLQKALETYRQALDMM